MFELFKTSRNSKIQNRLVWYYVIFAVFTVVLVTYLTYTQAAQSLRETVEDKLSTVAALKVDGLNRWVDEQQSTAVFLASLPELRSLTGRMLDPVSSPQERALAHEDLTHLVTVIAQRTSDYRDIQILDLKGNIVVSVSPRNVGSSQAGQLFFEEGLEKTFVQNFYESDLFGNTTLTVVTPLFDLGNKRVGVLALHFNMKRVDNILREDEKLNEAIQGYLINSNHKVITNDPIVLSESPTLESSAINDALNGGEGNAAYTNHAGIAVIGNYRWIRERNAALIVEIDEETALWPARRLAIDVAVMAILFSITLVIVVTVMARRITAPLRALTQTVTHISEGDFNASAPVLSDDEVGTLAQTFNAMTAKLRQTLSGLEKELHDRKQAEEALRQSEERYRTLFEGMQDGVYRSTHDGRFIDVNPALVKMFGYGSREEMLAVDIRSELYFSPEDRESLIVNSTQEVVDIYRMRRKDGSEIWVEDHWHYIFDADGNILYHEGLLRDITERIHAEHSLRDSEQKFRTVFESSPIAICITALEDGRMLEANYAYWDLMGYDPQTSIGKTAGELKLWEKPEDRVKFVQDLKRKGSLYNPDDEFENEGGKKVQAISFYRLVKIGDEERVISMFYDMSAQKQTMLALQQSETRVRALLDAIPDMIIELSLDGVIVNVIPPKEMDEPMPPGQFVGRRIHEVLSEPAASHTLLAIQRSLTDNQISLFEFDQKMDREVRAMEARVVPNSADTVIMMIRDITQRKWVETEREELINELELKNRESETLRESLASVVTTFNLKQAMEMVLDQIKLVIPYDTASVWRVEGDWQTLILGRDLPPEIPPESLKFRIDEDNSSRPILYGEKSFVLSNNVQEELSDFKEPHSYINSWLAVPLRTRGNIIGLIALDGMQRDQFNQHHADLAVTFADQLAIALENSSLFYELQTELEQRKELIAELEKKNAESETLRESAAIVAAALEVPETVRRILEQLRRVVVYDSASVWLVEGDVARIIGGYGLHPDVQIPGMEYVINETEPDYPLLTRQDIPYILYDDIQVHFPQFAESVSEYIRAWMAIPLRARGKLIGSIFLDGFKVGQFTEKDAQKALTYSNQVAIALENARLFTDLQSELEHRKQLIEELQVMNAEAETMRESLASIVGTFEFSDIIQRILDQIQLVVPYDSASIWRLDGMKQILIGERGLPGEIPDNLEFLIDGQNHAIQLFTGELPYIISHDVQSNPAFSRFQEEPHTYINSWLGVPLKARGRVIGLIALDGKRMSQFNERHAALAVTFADQVAIALENADLFSSLQTELEERKKLIRELEGKNKESETLRESTAVVAATLEISETVQRILEQIQRVVPYDSASVWLYQDDHAFLMGSNGLPPGAELPGKYILSENEPDYAFWKDKVPYILLDDIQEQYPAFRTSPKNYIHGWLTIPLHVRGKLTGFISLDSRTPGKFTHHDAELALTFASHVSIALENARLFTDLQTELEERRRLIAELELKNIESETLRESAAIVAATLEKNETIDRILEQLERVVPYDSASVQLVTGNTLEIVSVRGYSMSENEQDNRFEINENEPAYPVLCGTTPFVLFDDVQLYSPAFTEEMHNRIHAWMAVPLKMKGQITGIIALDGYQVGQFTERHAQLAVTYANQVAIALENARLYSDLQADLAIRQTLISELESKNAELERFTYTVSHDLKSPLFTIRGFLGYLEQDALAGNRERLKSDVQRITDATEKMQQLLNDLLELSRIGRLMNEPVLIPFADLAREAVALVQGRIMERAVAIHIDADLPTVYGDKPRLLEVVQNLVDNAAKFMGGQADPRIEIGWEGEEDGKPILYVRDNGVGIPPQHHERIFGLFNKLDVKVDGTGIGLSLVKRIVEVHGGRIWVQSEAGSGATFYLTLPAPPESKSAGV